MSLLSRPAAPLDPESVEGAMVRCYVEASRAPDAEARITSALAGQKLGVVDVEWLVADSQTDWDEPHSAAAAACIEEALRTKSVVFSEFHTWGAEPDGPFRGGDPTPRPGASSSGPGVFVASVEIEVLPGCRLLDPASFSKGALRCYALANDRPQALDRIGKELGLDGLRATAFEQCVRDADTRWEIPDDPEDRRDVALAEASCDVIYSSFIEA